jgi:hypothetical protein
MQPASELRFHFHGHFVQHVADLLAELRRLTLTRHSIDSFVSRPVAQSDLAP